MDFVAVVDQVIALLRQRGRLTYRTLQLQFQLDDTHLEILKDELIYGQRLAIDEEGRVLVWTGDTAMPDSPAAPVSVPAPPPTAAAPPDAERRQLTVMFCDLVDSTKLSSQLDPEEYRDVVRAYQTSCTEVIRRYDGHIAQLLGDGLLVYFGYPHAHEDDAHRAVRTGLGILAAMGNLNTRLQQDKGIQLALRMGIHTGLVVIGEMGEAGRQEQLALGEVPNVCSRIQGLAAPNTAALSEATYRLVQGYFDCEALGEQTLRGVAQPFQMYHVLQASGARGRLDVAVTRGLTPLVGRESEVTLLLERWEQVKAGHGHVVLLTGDAGIGKSRLVQMLKEHVAHEPHTCWECRSAEYAQNTALFPFTDLFQRLLRFHAEDTLDEKCSKLEQMLSQYRLPLEETVPLFASVLTLSLSAERYTPLALSPQRQRQKTLETLVAILQELAEHQPVLFIVEDLHWTDPTTLALLSLLIEQIPTTSILTVLTCRPTFQPSWHHRSYITAMTLNRLSPTQVEQILLRMTDGKTFPAVVRQQVITKTDGVPLFVEEITKAILESGHLKAVNDHYELTGALSTFAIPTTLHDSLMARLDRLVTAKAVAQYAAVIGRQCAYDVLSTVSQLDDTTLQRELGRLVDAEIVYQRGVPPQATYTFKHALIQDAAYESLLKSTRQHYHQRIAQVLEAQFPQTAEAQPEFLAHHCTEAGLIAQAVGYWQRAGQQASDRSAHLEAISHLTRGLEILAALPDTPERLQQELLLQTTLGSALVVAKGQGAPEVGQAYARARELCRQVGETPQLFPVLFGLWRFYQVRAEHQTARELAEQCFSLAQRVHDPTLLLEAHFALGVSMLWLGEMAPAHTHLEQGIALYDPQEHRALAFRTGVDLKVWCLSHAAQVLWMLGYADQAVQRKYAAFALAQELSHPPSLAAVLFYGAFHHSLRGEVHAALEQAEAAMALASAHGFPQWLTVGTMLRGWARAMQGQTEEGIAQIRQALVTWRAMGAGMAVSHYLVLLAEAYGHAGQAEAGLRLLAEAVGHVDNTGERSYAAEVYWLKGELLLRQAIPDETQAETCLHHAMDIARHQQAKSWELRAAMSLARLWQQQGKRAEASALLAPIYGWFTEGFDTADLQEAKALLAELAG